MQSATTSTAPAWWLEAMKRPGCWYKPKGAGIWLRVYATRQELDSWIQDWWDWLEFNSGMPQDAVRQASEELLRLRREMR